MGGVAAFVVPTRVLVHQTRREFARHAPGLPIGAFFGEEKHTVVRGLNLTTFATLQGHATKWSEDLSAAGVVFVDEAHHALTPSRHRALADAFPREAIRIALTATPDYDERRRLEDLFPQRIARVELRDALAHDLLAPARVQVAEVDIDGSSVEIVAGEFRADQLARLLSHGPVMHAALAFRYGEHRDVPGLITCISRQQADDLARYFKRHRPPARPAPGLILGETPPDERARILDAFESGQLDTLVAVGVLIEGWTSVRCKLLIDLAPGRSRVRATQKYFRALTRDGDTVAHLVVIVPRGLPRPPVLPMDLLLDPGETYTLGETIGRSSGPRAISSDAVSPIRGVRLIQRVVIAARLGLPRLDPTRKDQIRAVLEAAPAFNPARLPGRHAFGALYLHHPLFSGTGQMLLRWLRVPPGGYDDWLCQLYPAQMADRLLAEVGFGEEERSPEDDALPDILMDPIPNPEELLLAREAQMRALACLARVPEPRQGALRAWCGFDADAQTYTEIAEAMDRSRERTRQIVRQAIADCRLALYNEEDAVLPTRGRDSYWIDRLAVYAEGVDSHPNLAWALEHSRRGNTGVALVLYNRLLAEHPSSPLVQARLAQVLISLGRSEEADPHVVQVTGSAHGKARLELGLFLRARGAYDAAFQALANAPGASPWWAADVLMRAARTTDAEAWIAAHARAMDGPLRYHQILLLHRTGREVGEAMLHAFAYAPDLAQGLLDREKGDYLTEGRELWESSPGALDALDYWWKTAPVCGWLRRYRQSQRWMSDFHDLLRAIPEVLSQVAWQAVWRAAAAEREQQLEKRRAKKAERAKSRQA